MPLRSSLLLCATLAAAEPATPPAKPTAVTYQKQNAPLGEVAAELSKSAAGVTVTAEGAAVKAKCSVAFADTPFWEAVETAAAKTQTRVAVRDGGRTVALEPLGDRHPAISSASGPFRIAGRTVTGKLLLDSGLGFHEVVLDVHWEPRMPVYRIDNAPKVTRAADDAGTPLTSGTGSARHYPAGALTDMTLRLSGLTRASKKIAVLAGEFRATVAEKMLAVPFQNLAGKFPESHTVDGVKLTLKAFEKDGDTWNAELALEYPTGHPYFESFEEQKWLRDTRLRLVDPNAKPIDAASEDVNASGRTVTALYRFKVAGNPAGKGWSLVCETPGPLTEVTVPFELKNIPIP
jgi:hypothetical protein